MCRKAQLSIISPSVGWGVVMFYLLAFTSGGCIRPFVNLYLAEIGLDGVQIGLLQGWTALVTVLFTPALGYLADRSQRHRFYLGIGIALKSLFAPLTLLSNAFGWLTLTFSVRNISASVADALLNSLTLTRLRQSGSADLGSVRLWGSIGYAAMSMLAGWLAVGRSIGVLFPLSGLLGLLALPFVRCFPASIRVPAPHPHPATAWRRISKPLLWLLAIVFLFSFSRSGLDTFGFVYIASSLGADNQLIGLLGALLGLAPILGLYLADGCIRRWGALNTLMISFGLYLVVLLGYAIIPVAALAAPVVTLEGIAISIFLISLVVSLGDLSMAQHAAADQIAAQVTIPGLAGIMAQPVSGYIFDLFGGKALFLIEALVILVAMGLLWRRAARTTRLK